MIYDKNNIFAKILRGEIPCKKVYENDHVLAFHDINPQKKVHVLVIPKGEITLFFNKKNYNLNGWRLVDINNNITLLKIENLIKNSDIKKNFFLIPEENQ